MWWVSATAVGFLLVTGLAIWLARTSTARWEREKRTAPVPRHDAVAAPPPVGTAARLHRALLRAEGAIPRLPRSLTERLGHVGAVLSSPRQLLSHVPPLRQVVRPLASARPAARIRRRRRRPFRFPHRPHRRGSSRTDPGARLEDHSRPE